MTKATFSNGFTDTYKGHRDVKAAWAIILKSTGETLNSGHSLDAQKADKTARNNLRYTKTDCGIVTPFLSIPGKTVSHIEYVLKEARAQGYTGKAHGLRAFVMAHNAKVTDAILREVRIEVINL